MITKGQARAGHIAYLPWAGKIVDVLSVDGNIVTFAVLHEGKVRIGKTFKDYIDDLGIIETPITYSNEKSAK